MGIDFFLPFAVLTALVVYFIYTRNSFEKKVLQMYEDKFEQWKKHSDSSKDQGQKCKKLVGLVYEEQNYKLTIETFDKNVNDRLQRGKFVVEE